MGDIVHILAFILPVIAFLCVILVLSVNVYLKLRRYFLVRVNCWFCNQWTKVHYDEKNCFECPSCQQYNGFTADGDYNQIIAAQHDELLNRHLVNPKDVRTDKMFSNGLCHLCNNNQQLKTYQLANFIPLNEANFDVEIEHFEKLLEKAYKLCPPCEAVLKTTLNKQNSLLGLSFSQLRRKGLLLLDLNSSNSQISKEAKWSFVKTLTRFTLFIFVILHLIFVLMQLDYSEKNLKKTFPKWTVLCIVTMKNVYLTSVNFGQDATKHLLNYSGINFFLHIYENIKTAGQNYVNILLEFEIPFSGKTVSHFNATWNSLSEMADSYVKPGIPQVESGAFLCMVAMLLQFIALLWHDTTSFKRKLFHLVIWTALTSIHWLNPMQKHLKVYVTAAQVVSSMIILISMCSTSNRKPIKKKKLKRISKRTKAKEKSLGEFSDGEEVDSFSFSSAVQQNINSKTNTAILNCSSMVKPIFGQTPVFAENQFNMKPFYDSKSTKSVKESLNQSFISAKSCFSDYMSVPNTADVFNGSVVNRSPLSSLNSENELDIEVSLNKLHLSSPKLRTSPVTNAFYSSTTVNRPKPVISPSKFRNITQNSWVAGGFWRDSNGLLLPINNVHNLSRSSSQTSGFVSQTGPAEPINFNSLPSSINNSFCSDFECNSVFSEPTYCMNGSYMMPSRNLNSKPPYYNNATRTFYPILNREQLVYVSQCPFPNTIINQPMYSNNIISQDIRANMQKSSFEVPSNTATYRYRKLLND